MKLATLEKILQIVPIDGADFIEAAKIQGYWSVIKKGEYKVGDFIIFVQPDSLIPRRDWNKFLWPKNDSNPEGNAIRLKVCKFKRQISQGLVLPVSILKGIKANDGNEYYIDSATSIARSFGHIGVENIDEGWNVTEDLGITHYEKPIPACLAGKIKGNFPNFLRKTDEERILSYPEVLGELKGKQVYITTKLDGSSHTCYLNQDKSGTCSRNLDLYEDETNSFWKATRQFGLLDKMKDFGFNVALQSELYGEGIQDNHLGIKGISLACFNIFNIDAQRFLDYKSAFDLLKRFEIPHVPVIYEGVFNFSLEELQKMANELKYSNGNPIEGIVIRPQYEQYSEILKGRLSVKVISETFALKYGE